MPIAFSVNHEDGYFVSKYTGIVTTDEIIETYQTFFNSPDWAASLNELVDHSELDGSELTEDSLKHVANFAAQFYKENNIPYVKTAIYAPNDLPYGLSRMYDVMTYNSPELVAVFRDLDAARAWLLE